MTRRIRELDGVRGLAILMVVFWHYVPCQIYPPVGSGLHYLKAGLGLTWSGVDLFFVLSGFLIAGILMDHRQSTGYFKVFYVRRACRILPLYVALVGSYILIVHSGLFEGILSWRFRWLVNNPMPLWSYLTSTQNIIMGINGTSGAQWLAVTWSLAVEEQFYLVLPLLVYLLPRRILIGVLIAMVILPLLLRPMVSIAFASKNSLTRMDSLAVGALLACAVRDQWMMSFISRRRKYVFLSFLGLLIGAGVMVWRPAIMGIFKYTWFALLYGAFILVVLIDTKSATARLTRLPGLAYFGRISYGLYMCHQLIAGTLHGLFRAAPPAINTLFGALLTLTALAVSLGVATASYYWFESYFLRLGRSVNYSSRADVPLKLPEPQATRRAA